MVREGWLKHGPGHGKGRGREPFVPVSWDQALDLVAGELARVRREHGAAGHHGRLAGLVVGRHLPRGARAASPLPRRRRRLRRLGDELQLRLRAGVPAAHPRQPAGGDRAAHLVVVDRAARQADGAVRRRQSEEHAGEQGRLRVAFHRGRGSPSWRAPASRSSTSARSARTGPRRCSPEWIPIRPNTDTAMLLALTHTLVSEGLHDQEFLAKFCIGFERVLPYLMGETDGQPKDADWAAAITGVPAETIRALARRMAATRTMVTASWVAAARAPRRAAVLGGGPAGLGARPDRAAGRRLRFRLRLGRRHRRCAARVHGAGDGRHQESDQRHHPGGAHLRLPAASRRAVRLQRQARQLSRHPAGLLGRRQSVPSSPGHQQAAPRLAEARNHRGARAVVDRDRAPRRHRAAGDHVARAQRHRRRAARQVHHRDAAGGRAGRRGAQRLRRSSASWRSGSAMPRPTRRAATRWPGCGISTSRCRHSAGTNAAAMPDFDTFWTDGLSGNSRRRRGIRASSAISAPIPDKHKLAHAVRQDRALFGEDRGLRLRRLPAASRPGSSRGNGSAARTPRPIRCISFRASRATGCTARWIAARSAPAARSRAARRSRSIRRTRKRAASRTATWCAFTIRAARASPARSSATRSAPAWCSLSCGAWYDPADGSEQALCLHGNAERADARPGHLEARAGPELGHRAGRGRALERCRFRRSKHSTRRAPSRHNTWDCP